MKKFLASLLLVAVMVSSVFAIDIAVGGDLDFTHFWNTTKTKGESDSKEKLSSNFIGFNIFGDFQYAIVGLGANFSVGGVTQKSSSFSLTDKKTSLGNFNLKLLGKYPFDVGIAKLYPMAGFQFSFNTYLKHDGEDVKEHMSDEMKKDLNAYFFILGFGADISVADNVFVRVTPNFGFKLNKSSGYKDMKEANDKYREQGYMFNLGLGVGYRF
ncbi:MAG: porin family protein [Treponemataceae bacterium]